MHSVRSIAKAVRTAAERLVKKEDYYSSYYAKLGGYCYVCSAALVTLLKKHGHKAHRPQVLD